MEEPIQNGAGDHIVLEAAPQVDIALVAGQGHRRLFEAIADPLKQAGGAELVERQVADFIQNEELWLGHQRHLLISWNFAPWQAILEAMNQLSRSGCVDLAPTQFSEDLDHTQNGVQAWANDGSGRIRPDVRRSSISDNISFRIGAGSVV